MAAVDGEVIINCTLDDTEADAKLTRLQSRIQKIKTELEASTKKRDMYVERMEKIKGIRESSGLSAFGSKEYNEAEAAVQKLSAEIAEQKVNLQAAEEEAGRYAAQLAQIQAPAEASAESVEKTAAASGEVAQETEKASATMERLEQSGTKASEKMTKNFGNVSGVIQKFGKRILSLAKSIFVFQLLSGALRKVRDIMSSAIQQNAEASAALAKLKGAFLTLIQPIINSVIPVLTTVINLIAGIVTAVAGLVSSLFGTTAEASAAAAESLYNEQHAITGVGGAAKKAAKQLASFDEINKLAGEDAGGGGGGGASGISPIFEVSSNSIMERLKNWADNSGITDALRDIVTAIGKLKKGIEDFMASEAGQTLKKILTTVFVTLLRTLADAISFVAAVLSGDLLGALDALQSLSWNVIFGALIAVADFLDLIYGKPLKEKTGMGLGDATRKAKEFVDTLPTVSQAVHMTGENLLKVWAKVSAGYNKMGETIKTGWGKIFAWYNTNVKPVMDEVFKPFIDAWNAVVEFFHNEIEKAAENGGLTVGEVFVAGIKAGLVGIATVINGVVGAIETAINWIVSKINSLSFNVPQSKFLYGDLAGQHVGFNLQPITIPRISIPELAAGAVIPPNREFLAVLGDQPTGTNIEAPLETIKAAFRSVMSEQGHRGQTIVLELDRRELGRAVADVSKLESQRVGLKIGASYA